MEIQVNKTTGFTPETTVQGSTPTSAASSSTNNVPVGQTPKNEELKELYKKLCVTKEQFERLCKEYPGFETYAFDKQLEIVNLNFANEKVQETTSTPKTQADSKTSSESAVNAGTTASVAQTNESAIEEPFNHKEFAKLSKEEKEKTLALELAKNKFLYADQANPKSIEEWNALSPEEQQSLIKESTENLQKAMSMFPKLFDMDTKGNSYEILMTVLQTANESNIDFKKFFDSITDGDVNAKSLMHDYIFNLDESSRSDAQNSYIEKQTFTSTAISHALKESGDFIVILSPEEMNQKLKELGKTKEQVELDYLNSKKDKLTPKEAAMKSHLEATIKKNKEVLAIMEERTKDPSKRSNYGILEGLHNTKFGELYKAAQSPDEKLKILTIYSAHATRGMSPKEKAEFMGKMMDELCNDPENLEVVNKIFGMMAGFKEIRSHMARRTEGVMPEVNAANVDKYEDDQEALNAMVEAQNEIQKNDKERAERLKLQTSENATDAQMVILADDYSGDESLDVQRQVKERALNAEKTEHQSAMVEKIKKNSSEVVIAETAARADELNEDYQLEGLQLLTKDSKLATKAANESGVVTRMSKENQTEAFNYLKENIEKLYTNKDEAVEQLNKLSDQIKDLHKDNQLAAHTTMMTSEYSEVQEHTAANINNYDPTVQSEAMDVVYRSGNEKAIQAAAEVINKMSSPNVQQNEIVRVAAEMALNNATDAEINSVISTGTLTAKELSQLSPTQRREYFIKLFESAPPAKKIEMLMKFAELSGLANKRMIYTLIARTSMLTSVIESGMASTMLSAGLPVDAVNKIITVMKRSTTFQVKDQLAELKQDSGFSQYFSKDELDEIKEKKDVPQDMKRAFTAPIDSKTKKKLQEQDSTLYLNS